MWCIVKVRVPKKLETQLNELTKESARIWNETRKFILSQIDLDYLLSLICNKKSREANTILNTLKWDAQKAIKSDILHSQTVQAIQDYLTASIKSYLKNKSNDESHNLPREVKWYPLVWKNQAIKFVDGKIQLPLARGKGKIVVPLKKKHKKQLSRFLNEFNGVIRWVVITRKYGCYWMHIFVKAEDIKADVDVERRLFIDIGEIHPFVGWNEADNEFVFFNGRYIRSLKQLRLKLIAKKHSMLSKKQKGSRRWRRVKQSFDKQIWKLERKIIDLECKYIKALLDYCLEHKIGTVVIGDLKGIRENNDKGNGVNQKIHNMWRFRKLVDRLKYKLSAYGIRVVEVSEEYSTQLCPVCGESNKPNGRIYKCKCGFEFHRDFVGAIGIARNFYNFELKKGFKWSASEKICVDVFKVDIDKAVVKSIVVSVGRPRSWNGTPAVRRSSPFKARNPAL